MTVDEALAFIRDEGVVLASGKGPVPRMAEIVAGEPIRGSWWAHPKSHDIFRIFSALAESPEIVVCRIVGGKVSFVHWRLWPALARAASLFPSAYLARVDQEHIEAGHHVRREIPFPVWLDGESRAAAEKMSEEEALGALGEWTRIARVKRAI